MQARASTVSASDEKSQHMQTHAGLSKVLAGSLLDANALESEVRRRLQPLLSVRQVAQLLAISPATVYRMCELGDLPHFRVRNAIRVSLPVLRVYMEGHVRG